MIKKIFSLIFLFLIVFHLSSKPVLGGCTEGNYRCDSGGDVDVCEGNTWTDAFNCYYGCSSGVCNPAPTSSCTSNGGTCSNNDGCCSDYCGDGVCATKPAATATPTPCLSAGVTCYNSSTPCCSGFHCSYICAPNPPGSTPTPTNVPGCGTLNEWCNSGRPCCNSNVCWGGVCKGPCDTSLPLNYCENACTGVAGMAVIWCAVNNTCYLNDANRVAMFGGVAQDVGTRYCPGSGPTPTSYCHPITCYNAPDATFCPSFNPAGSPCFGEGNCDNCGGVDCGWCGEVAPPLGPTPTPGCTETCLADSRYPTTCYDSTFEICGNTRWCYGGLNCAPTTLSSFEIRRNDGFRSFTDGRSPGRDITDAQNRLHICDSFLSGESPNPRSVVYVAWLNNANGCGDIDSNSVKIKWLGNSNEIAMSKLDDDQNGPCAYVAYVTYPADTNIPSAQGFQITMKSIIGGVTTGWTTVTPDLKLKVWNCQVPVLGTLYDGSSGQVCPGSGFTDPIDVGVSFDSIIFSDSPDVTMTDDNLANYGTNNIVWGKNYLPFINGGNVSNIDGNLLATGRITRVTDLGGGTVTCPSSEFTIGNAVGNATIDPYSASPRAQIDFSFIRDQEAWYQVKGAGVKSRSILEYGVPVTAPEASRFLTLSDVINSNGLVSATSFANTNGNNNDEFGSPNNWWIYRNTNNLDIYNYNYFYNNFFVKAGVGVTGINWSEKQLAGGIYFVNDNLDINANLTVPDGETMMVIVSGNINIGPSVTRLDGIYIADGNISAGGDNTIALTINGMLYAGGNVRLYRSFTDKTVNNITPAVSLNYSPGLIFNLPPEIMRILSGWREE